jgi:hypothetical protein
MAKYEQTFEAMTTVQKVLAAVARRYTAREVVRIKTGRHMSQPKTRCTAYRMSAKQRVAHSLRHRHKLEPWKPGRNCMIAASRISVSGPSEE